MWLRNGENGENRRKIKSKIKNKDQEPAILGQHQQEPALRAQGAQGSFLLF